MSNGCSGNCGSDAACEGCGSAPVSREELYQPTHGLNEIGKVIGVVSGKGGVGKSLVSALLAVALRRKGYKVGILDADITGPSIPRMFGITKQAVQTEEGVYPQKTHNDIAVMSINLLLEDEEAPVIWRGPVIGDVVRQFWTDVIWEDLDFLILDMPPGTGDVPLTVFQTIKLDGVILVSSPQELVNMVVKKAYNMARMMEVPVLGVIENMSYYLCKGCGGKAELFGQSKADEIAARMDTEVLARIPVDPALTRLCDEGGIEKADVDVLEKAVAKLESL
ncbi:MAG: P-loop NTPase [Bacillota bacterium]